MQVATNHLNKQLSKISGLTQIQSAENSILISQKNEQVHRQYCQKDSCVKMYSTDERACAQSSSRKSFRAPFDSMATRGPQKQQRKQQENISRRVKMCFCVHPVQLSNQPFKAAILNLFFGIVQVKARKHNEPFISVPIELSEM